MKTKKMRLVGLILTVGLMVACSSHELKVKPLSIDLPASYRSDTAAYRFITQYEKSLNEFGKTVAKMYNEGEKWQKKEYESLSKRELYRLVKLDYDYAELWVKQGLRNELMLLEAVNVLDRVTEQGAAKIAEAQTLFARYYRSLIITYGTDLQLDKNPYMPTPEEDSLRAMMIDSLSLIEFERLNHERALLDSAFNRQLDSIRREAGLPSNQ